MKTLLPYVRYCLCRMKLMVLSFIEFVDSLTSRVLSPVWKQCYLSLRRSYGTTNFETFMRLQRKPKQSSWRPPQLLGNAPLRSSKCWWICHSAKQSSSPIHYNASCLQRLLLFAFFAPFGWCHSSMLVPIEMSLLSQGCSRKESIPKFL